MIEHFKIDEKQNRVELLDTRFYELDGKFYPSVTTILDAYPKGAAFYEWLKRNGENSDEIRDEFGRRGSAVHNLTEAYDRGEEVSLMNEGRPQYSSMIWAMFERYIEFASRFKPEILGIEMHYASHELQFGGTLDRVVRMDGKLLLIDIKTSNYLHNHFYLQVAAYAKLFEEKNAEKIDGIGILHLNAKTRTDGKNGAIQGPGWQLVIPEKPIEYYWRLFKATHALWNEENGSLKPKNIVYKLTHQKDGN